MIERAAWLVLLFASGAASGAAPPEPYFKAETILAMCNQAGDTPAGRAKRNLCGYYLAGVSDAIVTSTLVAGVKDGSVPPTLCFPDPIRLDTVSEAFRAYTKAAPDRHDDNAAGLAAAAMLARYPCGAHAVAGSKPDVAFFSADALLEQCTATNTLSGLYCLYYVIGVSDFSMLHAGGVRICYPTDMPDDQPRRTFIAYMSAHPSAHAENAAVSANAALLENFSCR